MFLRNVTELVPDYTASHLRRCYYLTEISLHGASCRLFVNRVTLGYEAMKIKQNVAINLLCPQLKMGHFNEILYALTECNITILPPSRFVSVLLF
jgi:hypothetical protein